MFDLSSRTLAHCLWREKIKVIDFNSTKDFTHHSHDFILIDLYHIHTVQYAQDRFYGTSIFVVHFAVAGIAVRLQ